MVVAVITATFVDETEKVCTGMKKGYSYVVVACLVLVGCGGDGMASAGKAEPVAAKAAVESVETYYAVVRCVDGLFYDGGHDVGDATREAIMTDALALFGQPAYDEGKVDGIDREALDMGRYMDSYTKCLSEEVGDKLVAIGRAHGMEVVSE